MNCYENTVAFHINVSYGINRFFIYSDSCIVNRGINRYNEKRTDLSIIRDLREIGYGEEKYF